MCFHGPSGACVHHHGENKGANSLSTVFLWAQLLPPDATVEINLYNKHIVRLRRDSTLNEVTTANEVIDSAAADRSESARLYSEALQSALRFAESCTGTNSADPDSSLQSAKEEAQHRRGLCESEWVRDFYVPIRESIVVVGGRDDRQRFADVTSRDYSDSAVENDAGKALVRGAAEIGRIIAALLMMHCEAVGHFRVQDVLCSMRNDDVDE